MSGRFFRIFAIFSLLTGVFTLFQAIRLYLSPTLIIEWSTASELDIAGFNVLRGEHKDGPFTQVNETLIPPAGDSLSGGDYSYEDQDVSSGQTYFYQLQEVELSGVTSLHGPIEAEAKRSGLIEGVLALLLIIGSILTLNYKPRT